MYSRYIEKNTTFLKDFFFPLIQSTLIQYVIVAYTSLWCFMFHTLHFWLYTWQPLSLSAGCKHVKGILLFGPPGCGKTLMARQIGKMLNAREPKVVNGPEILNKYVGESEANIRKLFADAEEEQKRVRNQEKRWRQNGISYKLLNITHLGKTFVLSSTSQITVRLETAIQTFCTTLHSSGSVVEPTDIWHFKVRVLCQQSKKIMAGKLGFAQRMLFPVLGPPAALQITPNCWNILSELL